MITSSFSSVSRCNSLKTENFLSLSHYLFFLSIWDSVSQAQQHQQEAELQLVAATVNIQHDPGPLHLAQIIICKYSLLKCYVTFPGSQD